MAGPAPPAVHLLGPGVPARARRARAQGRWHVVEQRTTNNPIGKPITAWSKARMRPMRGLSSHRFRPGCLQRAPPPFVENPLRLHHQLCSFEDPAEASSAAPSRPELHRTAGLAIVSSASLRKSREGCLLVPYATAPCVLLGRGLVPEVVGIVRGAGYPPTTRLKPITAG